MWSTDTNTERERLRERERETDRQTDTHTHTHTHTERQTAHLCTFIVLRQLTSLKFYLTSLYVHGEVMEFKIAGQSRCNPEMKDNIFKIFASLLLFVYELDNGLITTFFSIWRRT